MRFFCLFRRSPTINERERERQRTSILHHLACRSSLSRCPAACGQPLKCLRFLAKENAGEWENSTATAERARARARGIVGHAGHNGADDSHGRFLSSFCFPLSLFATIPYPSGGELFARCIGELPANRSAAAITAMGFSGFTGFILGKRPNICARYNKCI